MIKTFTCRNCKKQTTKDYHGIPIYCSKECAREDMGRRMGKMFRNNYYAK